MFRAMFGICILLTISGCGEYGDKIDKELIQAYKDYCKSEGFDHVQITHILGRPSAYYRCFNG